MALSFQHKEITINVTASAFKIYVAQPGRVRLSQGRFAWRIAPGLKLSPMARYTLHHPAGGFFARKRSGISGSWRACRQWLKVRSAQARPLLNLDPGTCAVTSTGEGVRDDDGAGEPTSDPRPIRAFPGRPATKAGQNPTGRIYQDISHQGTARRYSAPPSR